MFETPDTFWITRNPVGRARDALRSRRRPHVAPRPPGPRGRPVVGVLPELKADPFGYLRHLGDTYGDIYRLPLPLYDVVVMNHPDHVRHVVSHRNGEYSLIGPAADAARKMLGASMQMMEGHEFRRRRKTLAPMMGRQQLTRVAAVVADEFAERLAKWDRFAGTGEPVDLQREINDVVIPGFMRAMFSLKLSDAELHRLDVDVRTLMQSASSPLLLGSPPRLLPGDGNPVQAWLRMRRWVKRRVEERRAQPGSRDDLLQVLLDARYEDGTPLSGRDVITEAIMLIGGGYETVVAALSWTLAFLSQNPQAQQRLCDEVAALDGAPPTYADLDRLEWAKACFDEGQRLQGLLLQPRFAMIDDVVGGYRIRRGTLVGLPIYALQRDPRWWGPDADSYNPLRFYDKDVAAERPNLAFMPFGAGPHRCFGAAMGYLEAQFLLAQIHQRFRVQTPAGWAPEHDPDLPWPVKGGVPAVLTRASAA
ncbi:cytochrome P450 [Mycobacterium alsense]|uniref:Cytochrome P450 n=1 Tax=Mycobacterium alsense TaxID=324058 RepID=A0AA42C0A0_9MYCO|nr:cytochrome P450 [Mycobacterium alsense]MCV7380712.1 cytochrome P450 [Mycobacterium alsense]